jgi:putative DNA primase/helicase
MKQIERISTADLIVALIGDDENPWATYNRGKPVSPRQIAKRLKEYGIVSKNVRVGYGQSKGFDCLQFQDVFERYLAHTSPTPPIYPSHRPKSSQALPQQGLSGTDIPNSYVPKNAYPSQSQIPVNHAGLSGTYTGLGRWDGYEKNGTYANHLSVPRKPSDGKEWDVGTDKKGGENDTHVSEEINDDWGVTEI